MKKIFLASVAMTTFAFAAVLFQMASCKRSKADIYCPPPTYPVTGLWEGTYKTDQVTHEPTYIGFSIFPDGTIMRRSKVVGKNEYGYTRGRWTLTGDKLDYRDTFLIYGGGMVVETGTLTFKNNGTMTGGTWQNISGQNYTGTFQNVNRNN